jgi:hypothetical protein
MELKHITMNLSVEDTPDVIVVRVEPMRWRKDILPMIKSIAADVAGRPVRWADINVFESLGNTPEDGETEWQKLLATGRFTMYRVDRPGEFSKVPA